LIKKLERNSIKVIINYFIFMNKKTIAKFFVIGLGVFIMSGCSVYPFSTPNLPRIEPVPVKQTTTPEVTPVATSTANQPAVASSTIVFAQTIREFQEGKDYSLDYTPGYFFDNPKVTEVACDPSHLTLETCPCFTNDNFPDKKDFCRSIAPPEWRDGYCIQKWSGAGLGSTYTTYHYTTFYPGSTSTCLSLQLVKQSTTDCSVIENNSDAVRECESLKASESGVVDGVVRSLKMLASPMDAAGIRQACAAYLGIANEKIKYWVDADWKTCVNPKLGYAIRYPATWGDCAANYNGSTFRFKTDYKPNNVYLYAFVKQVSPLIIKNECDKHENAIGYYLEAVGDRIVFKHYGVSGWWPDGVIIGNHGYEVSWDIQSDQKAPPGSNETWSPDNPITSSQFISIAGSLQVKDPPQSVVSSNTPWLTYSGKCGLSFKYPAYLYSTEDLPNETAEGCNFMAEMNLVADNGASSDYPVITIMNNPGIKTITPAQAKADIDRVQSQCPGEKLGVKEKKLATVDIFYSICKSTQGQILTTQYWGDIISLETGMLNIFSFGIPENTQATQADMEKVIAGFKIK
jgi:hypothetical protein